jgi:hypothetical protein
MTMKIYIPTRGRPEQQRTAEALESAGIDATLVLSKDDEENYFTEGVSCITVKASDIATKRQRILELSPKGKILMLDDDLTFYTRKPDGNFVKADKRGIQRIIKWFSHALSDHAHAGLTDKFMGQSKRRGVQNHGRYNQALGYNTKLFPSPAPKFRVAINEEHDMHLQLATRGLEPIINNEFSKDAKYYSEGGCSTWRTKTVEAKAMKQFAALWPDLVKLGPTEQSISGLAARVRWAKAVKMGEENA